MIKNTHKKVWGTEEWLVNTDKYCGKFLNLKQGYRCSMHYHKNKDETFYILKGKVLMEYSGGFMVMNVNDSLRIHPNERHRFTGIKNSTILEVSTHHEDNDSYREESSGKVNLKKVLSKLNLEEALE